MSVNVDESSTTVFTKKRTQATCKRCGDEVMMVTETFFFLIGWSISLRSVGPCVTFSYPLHIFHILRIIFYEIGHVLNVQLAENMYRRHESFWLKVKVTFEGKMFECAFCVCFKQKSDCISGWGI